MDSQVYVQFKTDNESVPTNLTIMINTVDKMLGNLVGRKILEAKSDKSFSHLTSRFVLGYHIQF